MITPRVWPDVVSYRNSTSNHNHECGPSAKLRVVSYRNSTSNHNHSFQRSPSKSVVSYRNSTSNHNPSLPLRALLLLYLIEILHQTTTQCATTLPPQPLYLIEILHQTTTLHGVLGDELCCILSKFYIKPQRRSGQVAYLGRCILSKFYIKPQPLVLFPRLV